MWTALQQLAAPWLSPLPLVAAHGDFGSMFDPAAHPRFTECKLTNLGQLAVQSHRGQIGDLPIGLINGGIASTVGLFFDLWPTDADPSTIVIRPGLEPTRALAALQTLLEDPSVDDDEVINLVGPPWIGPFDTDARQFDELVSSGQQNVQLTPFRSVDLTDPRYPTVEATLTFGAPIPILLRRWIDTHGGTSARVTDGIEALRVAFVPGAIIRQPPSTPRQSLS